MSDVGGEAGEQGKSGDPRLAIALDVDGLGRAIELAGAVSPWFGVAKVGLELYTAVGPRAVGEIADLGFEVFVDLKLHDIPTTVGRAAASVGRTGARWLTIHTEAGADAVAAGVEGLVAGSGGRAAVLGVTVLTSQANPSRSELADRIGLAHEAGCGGVICAASDLEVVGEVAPSLVRVVPGIRLAGGSHHDQARVSTPQDALAAGASMLVIGRAVTAAESPAAAARQVADLIS